MFIWCRALATFALSPTACTLHWCRIGNLKFWLSALLSSLVRAKQILFGVYPFHRRGGSMLMKRSLAMSSAEAAWQDLKLLGVYWQLRGAAYFVASSLAKKMQCWCTHTANKWNAQGVRAVDLLQASALNSLSRPRWCLELLISDGCCNIRISGYLFLACQPRFNAA